MTEPITTWNVTTINGRQYLVVDVAAFRIPLDWDPSSNMFIAVGVPSGGYGNIPALLQGEPGPAITLDETINLTVLDFDDPSPDEATFTALTETNYQANITIHQGPEGDPGTSELDPDAYGTPVAGNLIVVNPTIDGFVYQPQLVGDRYIPAAIEAAPAGNPAYTVAAVSVPAQPFAWRPEVSGQCVITGTGSNVQANFIARLNNATTGNIIGMGFGPSGTNTTHVATVISPGPPAGSTTDFDTVDAGATAVIYFRVERQSGTASFTTSASTTRCRVRVNAIPGQTFEDEGSGS